MCGIVGLFFRSAGRPVPQEVLRRMCRSISHRGPDDEGFFVDGNMGMGMRRLAIIDLAGGRQPMFNEDGQVAAVFNGEIYNYQELRRELEALGHRFRTRSDTEVLVHGYEAWGERLPERLNGMFTFSIWDGRQRRLLLARDHIGIKPLYLYEDDQVVAWSSEIKAILQIPGVRAQLDPEGLVGFLRFGYVPAPRTMFRRIRKVEPATALMLGEGGQRTWRFWDVEYEPEEKSEAELCEQLRALLEDAVRRQLMSDVPLGAFLSGGLDSSAIVSTMHRLGVGHIATYSIGFDGPDAFHSELDKADTIAQLFGTDHHQIRVRPNVADLFPQLVCQLDEPMTDTSFVVTYLVSRLARETVKVILSGVGGDELFAGYRRYWGPKLQRLYETVPAGARQRFVEPAVRQLPVDRGSRLKLLFRYARGFLDNAALGEADRYQGYVGVFNGELEDVLTEEFAELAAQGGPDQVARYYREAPADDALNRMMYADLKTSLVDSLLAFTDKMSMTVSLEARVPLLDYRIVELAARIPPELKLHGFFGLKHVFKKALADRLPRAIIRQKKQGFGTPISRWFRDELRPLLLDMLAEERVRRRGYFKPAVVQSLIEDHLRQRADRSEHLLALLTFELWHEAYLD